MQPVGTEERLLSHVMLNIDLVTSQVRRILQLGAFLPNFDVVVARDTQRLDRPLGSVAL